MGILKQLLGGGYGGRHGYDSHGSRHGQRQGQYPSRDDAPASAAPQQALIACNACGASQAAGGRFCGQCGVSLAPPACPQCRAVLTPGASFCGQCGTRAQA